MVCIQMFVGGKSVKIGISLFKIQITHAKVGAPRPCRLCCVYRGVLCLLIGETVIVVIQ